MQLRTAGKDPSKRSEASSTPKSVAKAKTKPAAKRKGSEGRGKGRGKDESFEKLKKVKSLQRLSFSVQRLHNFRQVVQHVQLHVSNWAAIVN